MEAKDKKTNNDKDKNKADKKEEKKEKDRKIEKEKDKKGDNDSNKSDNQVWRNVNLIKAVSAILSEIITENKKDPAIVNSKYIFINLISKINIFFVIKFL